MSWSHLDEGGAGRMVDVGGKPVSARRARASARLRMQAATLDQIRAGELPKGAVLEVARLAGIQAAKRTWELIPLCHILPIDAARVDFSDGEEPGVLEIEAEVRVNARTGVEMEALTAVSVAALTVYDMCKAVDRSMVIERIRLEEKEGGRSGHFRRSDDSSTINGDASASPGDDRNS